MLDGVVEVVLGRPVARRPLRGTDGQHGVNGQRPGFYAPRRQVRSRDVQLPQQLEQHVAVEVLRLVRPTDEFPGASKSANS